MASVTTTGAGVHLARTAENVAEIDALAARLGGRVPLAELLDDLDRRGRRTVAPGRAVHRALTWNSADRRDPQWWPQGISTSADASADGLVDGRAVVAVAWYAKKLPGQEGGQGSRVTFLDLATRRYRHVLLVVPRLRDGVLSLAPLHVHAGGIVWVGDHLHVAATAQGLMTCRLDDLLRVPDAEARPHLLGVDDAGMGAFGYRYVLPVRMTHRSAAEEGVEPLRHSFASLDRSTPALLVGEYGRRDQSRRVVRFPIDPVTGLLEVDEHGHTHPIDLDERGARGSQGLAMAGGTAYVTVSHGPRTPGSVLVGRPGHFREHRWAVPMGPEDVAYWPQRDELWTATEHPRRRWIVSVKRSRLPA